MEKGFEIEEIKELETALVKLKSSKSIMHHILRHRRCCA